MSRPNRSTPGGVVQHVLNRGNDRRRLFDTPEDYAAFVAVIVQSLMLRPLRILEYCVMPNHWRFLVWPEKDNELPEFMHQLTTTHAVRWNAFRGKTGWGHVYQGPFKNFPVQEDGHLVTVARYVVRNALRGKLVERAEDWPWCSLFRGQIVPLTAWPIPKPENWLKLVNQPLCLAETEGLRRSLEKGAPSGDPQWTVATANQLGLQHTLRGPGRPKGSRHRKPT